MPCSGSCGRYSCSRNRLSGSHTAGSPLKISSTCVQRLDHLDARAASALVGLQQGRPAHLAGVRAQRADVVERDRARAVDSERAQQRRLGALAQLEREHVGAVQNPGAQEFQRSHVGERQRHRPRVTAQIRAWTRLIEVEGGAKRFDVAERCPCDVEGQQTRRPGARAPRTAASAIRDAREERSDLVGMSLMGASDVISCHSRLLSAAPRIRSVETVGPLFRLEPRTLTKRWTPTPDHG